MILSIVAVAVAAISALVTLSALCCVAELRGRVAVIELMIEPGELPQDNGGQPIPTAASDPPPWKCSVHLCGWPAVEDGLCERHAAEANQLFQEER